MIDFLDIIILSGLLYGIGCCLYALYLAFKILSLKRHLKEVEEHG